jgi:hypothetical protein
VRKFDFLFDGRLSSLSGLGEYANDSGGGGGGIKLAVLQPFCDDEGTLKGVTLRNK